MTLDPLQDGSSVRARVPLLISERGTTFDDWVQNLTIQGNGTVEPAQSEKGPVIEVRFSGSAILRSTTTQPWRRTENCCDEEYLKARWTTASAELRPALLPVWAQGAFSLILIEYRGDSDFCGRWARFETSGELGGWTEAAGQDEAACH